MTRVTPEKLHRRHMLVASATSVALAACGQAGSSGSAGGSATKSEYVVAPLLGTTAQLATMISRSEPMAGFLKTQTGLGVKAFAPSDYTGTIIGLRDGTIDFAFLPAILFLRAQDEAGARALYRTVRPGPGKAPVPAFSGIIAARADSGINGVTDLRGKKIGAGDPSDAAAWVLPGGHLKKAGVDPNKDATVQFRNSGADALVQVLGKRLDAAFAARHDLEHADVLKADADAAKTLKILATIENAPLEVVTVRGGVDAKVVDKFRAAFKNLGDAQTATFTRGGKTSSILGQWDVAGLVEAKDADFAALREAGKSIGFKLK